MMLSYYYYHHHYHDDLSLNQLLFFTDWTFLIIGLIIAIFGICDLIINKKKSYIFDTNNKFYSISVPIIIGVLLLCILIQGTFSIIVNLALVFITIVYVAIRIAKGRYE